MLTMNTKRLLAAFFVAGWSVCAGPAFGADGDEPVDLFAEEGQADGAPQVEVGNLGQVTLTANETDITMVLRILSMQSKRNIIASRNVSGNVSANLYQVDFYDALDAILQPNGFGYKEQNGFIYVKTLDELAAEAEANRKRVFKLVRLNYLSAQDASAYVSPLLSSEGTIAASGEVTAGFQPSLGDGGANSSAHADTLVIRDYEEHVEEILGLIEELDVQPDQVLIESTILQVRLTEKTALGVDFAVYGDIGIDDIITPLSAVDELINKGAASPGGPFNSGQAIQTTAGNVTAGQSGVKVGVLGSDASLFVRALDEVNDTNVLASPKMLVLNRQKGELLVGERLGYLSTTVTDTSETQTVEFLDIGVQLTARPFISTDERVRMELRASLSDGDTTRVVDGNVIPNETTQEVVTNVIMRNAQTIVLGGLFKEDTGTARNQLPGVGHVPGLGLLGKGQDDSVERSEVIFLVKPTIMKDALLGELGDELKAQAFETIPGARKGLLPWSRTKMTAAHMAKARQFLDAGDEKSALWHTNLALHLDPTMVEAMRMKTDLTGENIYFYHDRSMLNSTIDSMIDAEANEIAPEAEATEEQLDAADEAVEEAAEEAAEETTEAEALNEAMGDAGSTDAELNAEAETFEVIEAAEATEEAEVIDADEMSAEARAEMEAIEAAMAEAEAQEVIEEQNFEAEAETADAEAIEFEVVEVEADMTAEAEPVTEAQTAEVQTTEAEVFEFESLTPAEPAEYADSVETADAFESVTTFDDVEQPVQDWEDDDMPEQVSEVLTNDVEPIEAK